MDRSQENQPEPSLVAAYAEDLHHQAILAGHTVDELTAANQARKGQG